MQTARISSKGQIVIPKHIRDKVGLKPGSLVDVKIANEHIELIPLPEDPIKALRGSLKSRKSLASQLIKEHRREVRQDAKRH
jgi:AbrB family looped-hinge helix DNA binding protein